MKLPIAATPIQDGKFKCACCGDWCALDVSEEKLQDILVEAQRAGFTDPNESALVCDACYALIMGSP